MDFRSPDFGAHSEIHWKYGKIEHENPKLKLKKIGKTGSDCSLQICQHQIWNDEVKGDGIVKHPLTFYIIYLEEYFKSS